MPREIRNHLKYNYDLYNPAVLAQALTPKEARKEYTRLRSIAVKRLSRISGTKYERTELYQRYHDQFIKIKEMENPGELYYRLSQVARYLNSKTSTITGLKQVAKKQVAILQDHGYKFVTEKNILDFEKYMEEMRSIYGASLYDSERVAGMYDLAEKKGIPTEDIEKDFDFWLVNAERLADIEPPKRKNAKPANYYRKKLMKK